MSATPQRKIYYGHIMAGACFSIQAIGVGIYIAYGVFFNSLMTEFGWSRAVISGASSLAFLSMGLFGIIIGRLNDRYGPRILMTITAFFLGVGYMLMAKLEYIWHLYVFYGLIFGIGLSSIDVIALTTIARWFTRNRGMMTGIVKVGTGAGQLVLPLLATILITEYGWRNAYILIGSAALVCLVAIAQLLKRDPDHINQSNVGYKSEHTLDQEKSDNSISLNAAIRTPQLWTICIVNLTLVFCLMIIMVHIVPHARDIGVSAPRAASVLSMIGGVSMLGRFVTGIAIDRIGSRIAMIICYFLLIAGLLWLQISDALWMLYLFALIYGLAHGGFFTSISPIIAEFFGIGSHGAIFGIAVCFGTIGGAAGPMLAGLLFDITSSYHPAFWLITLMGVIGLGLIVSVRPIKTASILK